MNATDLSTGPVRVLGISGSLRSDSFNTAALRAVAALAGAEVQLDVWDGLAAVPPFNQDEEDAPAAAVLALREAITGADALLFATPEYNSSLPGQLKNALDWASRPYGKAALAGRTVAVIGASPSGFGAKWAQAELRKVLTACGAEVVGPELCIAQAHSAFGPDGLPVSPELRTSLTDLAEVLAAAVRDGAAEPSA